MSTSLKQEVIAALMRDFAFKREGQWLRKGKCPDCGKKELYTHGEEPKVLKCGRLDRCGYEQSIRSYYPEIFTDWSKRYAATPKDPNAAADAYLSQGRGLNLEGMRGCYTQEIYKDQVTGLTSATVRFPLPGGTWWERIIDQPDRFDRKARFQWIPEESNLTYKGWCWIPPKFSMADLAAAPRILIAEGIFNAWALMQAGHVAVSAMTVNNWPTHFLSELRKACAEADAKRPLPELVFAFDVGKAGVDYSRKFVARAWKEGWPATACQPSLSDGASADWNDLLEAGELTDENFEEYLWNGEVILAENATEKACLLYERKEWSSFSFTFDNRLWWASFNGAKIAELKMAEGLSDRAAARKSADITEIANCTFRTLYRERDELIDSTTYYLRIDFPGKTAAARGRFSASQLTAAPEFKKRLFDFSGQFTGTTGQLDRLMLQQTRNLKTVEPIDFTGYSKAHEAWILGDIAVRKGRVYNLNSEDYFDFGKMAVKLKTAERLLQIDYDPKKTDFPWIHPLSVAFGYRGLITLTYWQMSLFAEQIRAAQKSLAFLEITGEPGSGKSTLIEFLWRLYGRDGHEGFDPTGAKTTSAAIARHLGKVSGLPVVLIEGDRADSTSHSKRFEWDELKTAYNGRPVRSRGVKSSGNETYDPPFRGSIVIAQNYAVKASPALLERLMSITINKDNWTPATKEAADLIEQWKTEDLSGFIIQIARQEKLWMETYLKAYKHHEANLPRTSGINHQRLVKNHAQLAAALDAMCACIKMPAGTAEEGHAFIAQMLRQRHQAISSDHPHVAKFWELVDWFQANEIEGQSHKLNLSKKRGEIAISLPMFEERCRMRGIVGPPIEDLKNLLRSSKSRRFIAAKNIRTNLEGRVIHCWIFDYPEVTESE